MLPFFIIISAIISFCLSQNEESISISNERDEKTAQKASPSISYTFSLEEAGEKIIQFTPVRKDKNKHLQITASTSKGKLTFSSASFKQFEDDYIFHIPVNKLTNKTFYLEVSCIQDEECDFDLAYQLIEKYQIKDNFSFDIQTTKNQKFENIEYTIDKSTQEDIILLTFLGSSVADFSVTAFLGGNEVIPVRSFVNGYSIIVDKTKDVFSQGGTLSIALLTDTDDVITVSATPVNQNTEEIYENMIVLTYLGESSKVSEKCYKVPPSGNFIINARAHTSEVEFSLGSEGSAQNKKTIKNSGFFRFTSTESLQQVCVKTAGSTGLQFQLVNEGKIPESQKYQMFAIRGAISKGYLPKGKITFYRMNTYLSAGYLPAYYLHKSRGSLKFYKGVASNFPKSVVDEDTIAELDGDFSTKHTATEVHNSIYLLEDMNTFMIEYPEKDVYHDSKQLAAIVQCSEEEDCEYDYVLKNEYDSILLKNSSRIAVPISGSRIKQKYDYYKVSLNENSIKELYISLYSFSGDADLDVYSDKDRKTEVGTYYQTGNKEFYVVNSFDIQTKRNFYIKVSTSSESYYSIQYNAIEDSSKVQYYEVPSGEAVLETISVKQKKVSYALRNPDKTGTEPYAISVNALNCAVKTTFNGKEYQTKTNQFVVQSTEDMYKNDLYPVEVELLSLDSGSQSENENCMVYFAADLIRESRRIALNEGVIHTMTLSSAVKKMSFIYPLSVGSSFDSLIIYFSKQTEGEVKLSYKVGEEESFTTQTIKQQRKTIYKNTLVYECVGASSLCPVIIDVELGNKYPESGIVFDIQAVGTHSVPTYLPKGVSRLDGIKKGQYQYYYSDLKKLQYVEVVVNFFSGSGFAVAKLVKKGEKENQSDWNKSVKLPKAGDSNLLKFDYYNKKFVISEEDTAACTDGCEIYIGVYSDEEITTANIKEFTIFIRDDDTVTNLPLNEYAFGSLSKTEKENEYDYFQTKIQKDSQEVVLYLKTDLCVVYVNYGETKPTSTSYNFKLDSNTPILTISSTNSLINEDSLYGKIFTFSISTKVLDGNYDSYYSFKVTAKEQDIPIINQVTSSQSEYCEVDNRNPECYFLIPIYSHNLVDNILLYAMNEYGDSTDHLIFAKRINMEDYDNLQAFQIKEQLPNETNHDYPAEGQSNSNYLLIPRGSTKKEEYFIVMVKQSPQINSKSRIALLSGFSNSPTKTYLRPNSNEIFYIKERSKTTIYVYGSGMYFLECVVINGTGTMTNKNTTEQFTLNTETKETVSMVIKVPSSLDPLAFEISPLTKSTLSFYIKFSARTSQGTLDEIEHGRANRIVYSNESKFPINVYLPIYNEKTDYTIHTKIDYDFNDENLSENCEFKINGYIVDQQYIINRKKDSEAKIESPAVSSLVYSKTSAKGSIIFRQRDMQNYTSADRKNLYISITTSDENASKFKKVYVDITSLSSSSAVLDIPIGEYYPSTVPQSIQIFKMSIQNKGDHYIEIEFSSSIPDLTAVTLNKYSQSQDYTKNDTSLNVTDMASSSKRIITITLPDEETYAIAFGIKAIPKSVNLRSLDDTSSNSFILKYRSSATTFQHLKIVNNTIESFIQDQALAMLLYPPIYENGENVKSVVYQVQFYPSYMFESEEQLNTIFVGENPLKTENIESKDFSGERLRLSVKDVPEEGYVSVVATGYNTEANDYETLGYKAFSISRVVKVPYEDNGSSPYWVIGLVLGLIVIFGLGGLIFYRIKKRRKQSQLRNEKVDYNQVNFESMPGEKPIESVPTI